MGHSGSDCRIRRRVGDILWTGPQNPETTLKPARRWVGVDPIRALDASAATALAGEVLGVVGRDGEKLLFRIDLARRIME
jgi:hypothetical protein